MSIFQSSNLNRRAMFGLAGAGMIWVASGGLQAAPRVPRILFVCQYGSVKSAIARELMRRRAAERGIAVAVSSRGVTPEAHLAPAVQKQLAAEGIDPERQPLTRLKRADLRKADIVVAFNPIPQKLGAAKALDWSATPSVNEDYAHARPEIDRRIEALLDLIIAGRVP